MNSDPISWKSRRQDNVCLTTSEDDFVAVNQAAQEVIHLREALRDVSYQQSTTTGIFEDNLAWIAMNRNPVRRKISRHIDIRRYFIRELVKSRIVKVIPIRTHKMVADALTKSLLSPAFVAHRKAMLGHVPFSLKYFGNCRTYMSTTKIKGRLSLEYLKKFFWGDLQGLLNVNTSTVCMGESYEV